MSFIEDNFKTPDSQKEKNRKDKVVDVKAKLSQFYYSLQDLGDKNHIITMDEAIKVLGVGSKSGLISLLKSAFNTASLNDVLEVMQLPTDPKKKNRNYW